MTLYIDVSSNNHPGNTQIAYPVVAMLGHVSGAYIKATESVDYKNPWRDIDTRGFIAENIEVGHYHFARPLMSDPHSQADWFLRWVSNLPSYLPYVLDLESGAQMGWPKLSAWTQSYLQAVESSGRECALYVNRDYLANLPGAPWGRKLWLAAPGMVTRPQCWLWQFGQQQIPGIAGKVDVNLMLDDQTVPPTSGEGMKLNAPIVGPPIFTVSGLGYWLVAADGGIFAFGDAEPFGADDQLPAGHLNASITGAARSPGGHGLLLVAGDGGTFAFGDAPNYGSIPGLPG